MRAFLIPYFIFLFGGGLPMFFLEVNRPVHLEEGSPAGPSSAHLHGIGYASIVIVSLLSIYYIVILACKFYYLFSAFQRAPWAKCKQPWNTEHCVEDMIPPEEQDPLAGDSVTNFTSPSRVLGSVGYLFLLHLEGVKSTWESPGLAFTAQKLCPCDAAANPLGHPLLHHAAAASKALDSQFVEVEGQITSIVDLYPSLLRKGYRREIFIAVMFHKLSPGTRHGNKSKFTNSLRRALCSFYFCCSSCLERKETQRRDQQQR
ncbi:sodium- and chloride-dependent taurine transporter isoform X3 [Lates japonicus]|uniref:Sodium- and chloride-dependent taurine transporter isoform X3 n=1 Tax=Lates japonicus TaxID=270547 RepID=A0AAD3QVC5_LATJO|nr:sodium- and chloride-dependent taurine transporter isoform X3 [Lates japonicus]